MLRAGVDKAEKEIKKLPKDLKELSKYKAYELVVVNFKESLPVIVNLKNDAVKQARSRRFVEVPSFDATRLMVWVVSLSNSRPVGPRRGAVAACQRARSPRRRLHDHMRVYAPRESVAVVSRRCRSHTGSGRATSASGAPTASCRSSIG